MSNAKTMPTPPLHTRAWSPRWPANSNQNSGPTLRGSRRPAANWHGPHGGCSPASATPPASRRQSSANAIGPPGHAAAAHRFARGRTAHHCAPLSATQRQRAPRPRRLTNPALQMHAATAPPKPCCSGRYPVAPAKAPTSKCPCHRSSRPRSSRPTTEILAGAARRSTGAQRHAKHS